MQRTAAKFDVKSLTLRVITGAAMCAVCLWLTVWGGKLFAGAIGLLSLAMVFEWTRLVEGRAQSRSFFILSLLSLGVILCASAGFFEYALLVLILTLLGFAALSLIGRRAIGWLAIVPAYVILPCIAIIWIRTSWAQGLELTVLVFGIVWMTDIGAYFAGKFFGGAKLAPKISPAKTWAGFFGGITLGGATAILVSILYFSALAPLQAAMIGVALSLATVAGDLIESGLKRNFGVKDASGFIPGHGGVLDRVDGMIVAVLVMAVWLFMLRHIFGIQAF